MTEFLAALPLLLLLALAAWFMICARRTYNQRCDWREALVHADKRVAFAAMHDGPSDNFYVHVMALVFFRDPLKVVYDPIVRKTLYDLHAVD